MMYIDRLLRIRMDNNTTTPPIMGPKIGPSSGPAEYMLK